MARKPTPPTKTPLRKAPGAAAASKATATPAASPITSTPVRNSPLPKAAAAPTAPSASPANKLVTHEMIAARAYEISRSPSCGSEFDNWVRAERELRGA